MSEGAASTPAPRRVDFLAGVRVLELGDGVAGASSTSVLWALGAEVSVFVDPCSPHRRGRPDVDRRGARTSLLSIILDQGKRRVTVDRRDELEGLLSGRDGNGGFDLVVVDRVHGVRGVLAEFDTVEAYVAFVEEHSPPAWLTISAFGLTGERAGDVATELTVAAAAGMLAVARDEHSGQPLKLAGQQSLLNTGQAAALAACHALELARDSASAHLDLSAVEATIATGPTLEVGNLMLDTGSPGGARRYGAPAGFYKCTDGLIRISAMEDHQWQGVVEAMDTPTWTEQFATVEARIEGADVIDEHVAAWTNVRSKVEAEALLQARGVPATALSSPVEPLGSPQLAHREALEPLPLAGMRARAIGLPFRVVGEAGNADGHERRRRSLRGLRMLEAGRVLAVPLAGSILGALGAEVTKLEDLPRLDMYRRRGPYIDGATGFERGAYFALVNHSKQSAAFDVDSDRRQLDALLAQSDVVLENLRSKRASALGLGAPSASACHPDLLAISSSGFGLDGPHAAYRAYAYNLQASCGLGFLTRNERNEPAEIDIAWADLISAYALATIIAAWAVGPSGNRGVGLDFAMSDLVVAHFNEFIAATSLTLGSDDAVDRANELSPYAPHGVYRTADGWLALAIADDDEFGRLAKVLDDDRLAKPAFTTAATRSKQHRALDTCIGEAVRTRLARDLAVELRGVDLPAEEVKSAADLLSDPQIAAREFLTPVEHAVWGRRRLVGIPWRPYGHPALRLGPPPLLASVDAPDT